MNTGRAQPKMARVLQKKEVRLAPVSAEHAACYIRLANIPDINRRINKPLPFEETHFAQQLEMIRTQEDFFAWMIEREGTPCGVINFGTLRDRRIFQGGYWMDPEHAGRGAASGALAMVSDFLFGNIGAVRIQAVVEPDNLASIRVLEKAGYMREGLLRRYYPHLKEGLLDVYMYARVSA